MQTNRTSRLTSASFCVFKMRVRNDGIFSSAEIREGWLVADVREGSNIVMAFNEDFRKADRQLDTKVTTMWSTVWTSNLGGGLCRPLKIIINF